jgi:hypothetical protein
MKPLHLFPFSFALVMALTSLVPPAAAAPAEAPAMSAKELAGRMGAANQSGSAYVRLRMEVKEPPETTRTALQLQIKERRSKNGTEVVYQVLWPKERKGEAVLIRAIGGRAPSGAHFVPPEKPRLLGAGQMDEPLFGSDLTYADVVEDFFGWGNQTIVGNEVVNRVSCVVLESKPGKGDRTPYASVRTWIDTRRMVPLRVEKYSAPGRLARRIDTTRVANDDRGRAIPANLSVRDSRGNSVTELDGSRIKHEVTFSDRDFTPEGLVEMGAPRSEE